MENPRPVVLVHGIFDTPAVFTKMAGFLKRRGFRVHMPPLEAGLRCKGVDALAHDLQAYIKAHVDLAGDPEEPPGGRFDLVGYSMGGLVSRYYLQRLGGLDRVRRFVSLSTPHHGSRMAYVLRSAGCRQMRPGSPFLQDLNADVHRLEQVGIVSIWTPLDLMVVPPRSSHLPVGDELKLPVLLHPLMPRDRRSIEAVGRYLAP